MLHNESKAVNTLSRQVVLRHPKSMEVVVMRKTVLRQEIDPATGDPSTMGGSPTLGGMGVLKSEDEDDFEYVELGEGKMVFTGIFQPQDMIESDNALVVENQREVLIESKAAPGEAGHFLADSSDLVLLKMGDGNVIAYEVATVQSPMHMPPYPRKLLLNPRDDLNYVEPFDADGPIDV